MEQERIPRESEPNTEAMRTLEAERTIHPKSKFLILSVYLGLKPTAEFQTSFVLETEKDRLAQKMTAIIDRLGLVHMDGWEYDLKDERFISLHYSVARNAESLSLLREANKPENATTRDELLGKAYGIPSTAVEAYRKEEKLVNQDISQEISEEDRKFLFFKPSRSHWKSEVSSLHEMIEKVKEVSPDIYHQVIQGVTETGQTEAPKVAQ